jgi:hypothetical protein
MVTPPDRAAGRGSWSVPPPILSPIHHVVQIKDPRPKGRGIPRRDGEPFSCSGEPDVGLADASNLRRKRRGMRPEEIQSGRPATNGETVLVNDLVVRLVPPPCGKQLYVATDTCLVTPRHKKHDAYQKALDRLLRVSARRIPLA